MNNDNVAGNQFFGGDAAQLAIAHYGRLERQHAPDRGQRLFGLALLDESHNRIDKNDAKNHARVHPVGEQGRHTRRRKQDVDQDVVELQKEAHQRTAPTARRQAIRSEALQS